MIPAALAFSLEKDFPSHKTTPKLNCCPYLQIILTSELLELLRADSLLVSYGKAILGHLKLIIQILIPARLNFARLNFYPPLQQNLFGIKMILSFMFTASHAFDRIQSGTPIANIFNVAILICQAVPL